MTATATVTATERRGVLLVPNTALRFAPASAAAPAAAASGDTGLVSRMMPRPPPSGTRRPREAGAGRGAPAGEQERRIWVLQEQQPVPVSVRTGISDGRRTEVSGAQLREGVAVIIDQKAQ